MNIIGGHARLTGVTFYSDEYISTATRKRDGSIKITKKRNVFSFAEKFIKNVPFLRGLKILFNPLVFIAFIVGFLLQFVTDDSLNKIQLPISVILIIVLAGLILIYRLFQYHGAEHKAFNAYLHHKELSLENVKLESRVSHLCGSNLVLIYVLLGSVFYTITQNDYIVLALTLSLGYEIRKNNYLFKVFCFLGNNLQKYITTIEPNDKQLEVAIKAFNELVNVAPQIKED